MMTTYKHCRRNPFSLAITLIAFFCFTHATALAQDSIALNISVSPGVAQPGETVTLSFNTENEAAAELFFYGLEVGYDASRFSFEGITAGDLMGENPLQIADNLDDNTIGASVVRTSGAGSGAGNLATMEFTALFGADEGSASFSFTENDLRNAAGENLSVSVPASAEAVIQDGEHFTVYYNNPNGWAEVFTYVFSSDGGDYVPFPGEAMTPPEADSDWYSYDIPVTFNGAPMNRVIFNNNNGGQTGDLERDTDGWYDGTRWYDSEPNLDATRPVTFSVDKSVQIANNSFNPETDEVYLRGINQGWDAQDALVMEAAQDEEAVYEVTVTVDGPETGLEEYKYYRAPSDNFGAGVYELEGEDNRVLELGPANEPQILDTVFFDNEAPAPDPDSRPVTFSVDMSVQIAAGNFDPEVDEARLTGGFTGWETNITLVEGENNVYSTTVPVEGDAGSMQEYKFGINGVLEVAVGEGENGNRVLTLGPADEPQILDTVFFNNDEGDDLPETVIVWPGDTNNDGSVNEADVLPLGTFWNATGPVRENATTDWEGQETEVWLPIEATYADTDGSGIVNQTDLLAIGLNFGETTTADLQDESLPLAEVSLPALNESDKIIISLRSPQSLMLQGASFGVHLAGVEADEFSFQEYRLGGWASGWLENNALIEFERSEALQFSAAAVHKGLTETVVASELSSFEIHATNNWNTGATLYVERASYVNETGEQLSFDEILIDIEIVIGTSTENGELPVATALHQNYPNPFNPTTNIAFDLQEQSAVTLEVLNVLGQRVATLVNRQELSAGSYTQSFDASRLPSGVYLIRMSAGEQHFTRKMMLVK